MTPIPDPMTEEETIAVLAINIGQPKPLPGQKHEVLSGIVKHPVSTPVFLSFSGMTGDAQRIWCTTVVQIRLSVYTIIVAIRRLSGCWIVSWSGGIWRESDRYRLRGRRGSHWRCI